MEPYYRDDFTTIYNADCLDVFDGLTPFDVVVTDPPYNINLKSTAKTGTWGDLMNGAFFYTEILKQLRRLTHIRQGCAWVFNSWRSLPVLAKASYESDWPIESMLVWDKDWIGPGGMKGLRPAYEFVALYVHDGFAIPDRGTPDIRKAKHSSHKEHGHPAEKPVDLIYWMLRTSLPATEVEDREGMVEVLDPFMGSGSTLVAARRAGMRSVGIEIEERWCEVAATRASQQTLT